MQSLRAFPTLVTAVAALAVAVGPAAAANPQIISRLDGTSGTPFPAALGGTAGDGRYVILRPKTASEAEQLGVAQPADPSKFYLRDRTAGATTELALRATPGGPALLGDPIDLSNDATRVLFFTHDPSLLASLDLPISTGPYPYDYTVVADLTGGNVWLVRDASGKPHPASPVTFAGTGRAVLLDAPDPSAPLSGTMSIQRAHDDRATEVVLSRPDGSMYSKGASDDLSTVLYDRVLQPSRRPEYAEHSQTMTSATGLSTPQGARIILQGEAVEKIVNPGGKCEGGNLRIESVGPTSLALSADGQRVSYTWSQGSISQSAGDEGRTDAISSVVIGPGGVKRTTSTTTSDRANQVWPRTLAATHDLFAESSVKPMNWDVPELDDYGTGYSVKSASSLGFAQSGGGLQNQPVTFADGDRTILWSSQTQAPFMGQVPPASLPYAYAEELTGPLPASSSGASLWSTGVPDTPELASKVTWADCQTDDTPAPVAPASLYANIALRGPVISSASAGTVKVDLQPPGYRRASKVTMELKVLGISYWRKTVTAGDSYALPRPLLWLPLTLTATASPVEPAEGEPVPKPVSVTRGIFASR